MLAPLLAAPQRAAILLDVDGTLAPIAPRPEQAAVPGELTSLLEAIAKRFALVACISGRRAREARALVGVEGIAYIGNHGLERLEPGAAEPVAAAAVAGRADAAARFVAELDPERLTAVGIRLEDKGPIQALHWRGAQSRAAAELQAREVAAAAEASGLVAHWGRRVLELRPTAAVNKGTAVRELLAGRRIAAALYAGDDRTDLDAFTALREMAAAGELEHAICVGVASEEGPPELVERAELVVDGAAGIGEVLAELAG